MYYDMPLYRPPSEAYSLIIQVTLGCSHNNCSFCSMYKSKKFSIKPIERIKEEIDFFRKQYKFAEKIFLADGDALIIPTEDLKEILNYIKLKFPECKRITCYGSPKSILLKSVEALKELQSLGLAMVYLGIESGDDDVLKQIHKGATKVELLNAGLKIKEANLLLSVTVIAGIGGKERSVQHGKNTGELISEMNPDFLGILSLMVEKNTELYNQVLDNTFCALSNTEVLEEIKMIIENIHAKEKILFRSNHASNYIVLKGELPQDKEKLLKEIQYYIDRNILKPEHQRRL